MQPHIDKNNRWRQDILAIEERFATTSYPFRSLTTLMGLIAANSFTATDAFVGDRGAWEFRPFVHALAYAAMHNTYDSDHEPRWSRPPVPSPVRMSPRTSAKAHFLIPIKCVVGWKGKLQQKCAVCRVNCGYCCSECSDANGIFPLHPHMLLYKNVATPYACCATHSPALPQ